MKAAIQAGLQAGDERRIAGRPARPEVAAQPLHVLLVGRQKPTPVRHLGHQRNAWKPGASVKPIVAARG